ncbi:hypothetical protein KAW65_00180 [candidate division WOR-3 bacterium]|nr:hypothetical protein [candidate division WOR-3 bacterium]
MEERTLVLLKPDAIKRNKVGCIITKFEDANLQIEKIRTFKPTPEIVSEHYKATEKWLINVGNKTITNYKEVFKEKWEIELNRDFHTSNPLQISKMIKKWLVNYLCGEHIIGIVFKGNHAVEVGKKLVGDTMPLRALPGTIRGDFAIDSADLANKEKRAVRNLVHVSEDLGEAQREISLWFKDEEKQKGEEMDIENRDLEEVFKELKGTDKRKAAEVAYVLAILKKEQGDIEKARSYGEESINLFKQVNVQSFEDAAARYVVLKGVALPSYIHENVVRDRLSKLRIL